MAATALEVASRITTLNPELVDSGLRAAVDLALNVTARSLSYFVRKDMEAHHPEDIPVTENPRFRPYSQIVEEGIHNFERNHPGKPVIWVRNSSYTDVSQYFRDLTIDGPYGTPAEHILWLMQYGEDFNKIKDAITLFLPQEVRQNIDRSEGTASPDLSVTYKGETGNVDFWNVKCEIEAIYDQQEVAKPLSVSTVIEIMLEKHQGNLAAALYSTAGVLKYMSRMVVDESQDNDDYTQAERNEWFQTYIADEYSSLVPYQSLDNHESTYQGKADLAYGKAIGWIAGDAGQAKVYENGRPLYYDFSLSNQIGKPYHAANVVALLEYFPPEVIVAMVAGEYARYGAEHGANKALADVMVLLELRNVEKVLKRYEQPETPMGNKEPKPKIPSAEIPMGNPQPLETNEIMSTDTED